MDEYEIFEKRCRDTSFALRRLPKELRKAMSVRVKPEIAVPLAAKIASAAGGPWGPVLAAATKARAGADPTIVVGGARKVVSGKAAAYQLVYGVEFGANPNTTRRYSVTKHGMIPGSRGATKVFMRHATRQFVGRKHPFIFPTIRREGGWILDQFATIADDVLTGELPHG